jgi:hypothetical protein
VNTSFPDTAFGSDVRYKILENIATFTEKRSKWSFFKRARKKQSDADEIKKWEKELEMAYERFGVGNHLLRPFYTR